MTKTLSQKKQNQKEWFSLVVDNALSFLNSSIVNIDKSPKNSIIDLYTAIELLFKARLMKEHWSLILAKPENANIQKFEIGDFQSVYLEQAQKRLTNICKETFEKEAIDNFLSLGMHRNQIVHFAHTNFGENETAVVIEHWASWFYIHDLLKNQWLNFFSEFQEEIDSIHTNVLKNAHYLDAVYKAKTALIDIEVKKGNQMVKCPSCGFLSATIEKDAPVDQVFHMRKLNTWGPMKKPAKRYKCFVCGVNGYILVDV